MSTYIIGIGGTGAKIIESLIHLSAAGLVNNNETINLFFADPDVANGNGERTVQIRDYYNRTRFTEGIKINQAQLEYKKDNAGKDNYKWTILNNDIDTLRKLFSAEFNNEDNASKLLNVLYSKDELDEPLEKGFKGHPNIGSLVISKNFNLDKEPWSSLFSSVTNEMNNGGVRIIICGSVFGGTGAAGVPTITKLLYNKFKDLDNVTVNGILMLPYFSFVDTEGKGLKAKSDKFLENTRYALEYYHNEKYYDYYRKLYIIGDELLIEYPEFALGGNEQKNPSLMPELIAAFAVKDIIEDANNLKEVKYCKKSETSDPWENIPMNLKEKGRYIQYLLYSLHYVNLYYPLVSKFVRMGEIPRSETWAINYFTNRNIFITEGKNFEVMTNMHHYCEQFIRWSREIFSASRADNYMDTSLFDNNSSQIKDMKDLTYLLPTKLGKEIRYDRVYKNMNRNRTNGNNATIGDFFNDLYDQCKI